MVKNGDAAETICEKETKMKRRAILPKATDAQKASASIRTFATVSRLTGRGSSGRKTVANAMAESDQQQSMWIAVSITCTDKGECSSR
eukprot:scaffold80084_cov37-Tisochrysis_lutea.AAC.2